ncbi:MAG: hypothetical protein DMG67_07685 [Acidobacteria bacterium]|nr:MAG: hypothetical protein DMG67_07685 [Acidobacteriota bacterium]
MLLEREGYKITSALSRAEAVARCKEGAFDLLILGHSLPTADKQELIAVFRRSSAAPILSLRRQGEPMVAAADYNVLPDSPEDLLKTVANIFTKDSSPPEPN